jgi:ribosomal protein S12 methylthiotransferase accessory factor
MFAGRQLMSCIFLNVATNSIAMTPNPIERSYSLQAAEAALVSELDKLGYHYDFQFAGEHIYTCKCVITEKATGNFLASGNGKGEKDASRIGSLFEATEHLFSHINYIDADTITYLESQAFCQGNPMCDVLPLATLKDAVNVPIPFLEYKAVNGTQGCFYPLALSCPQYIDALLENEGVGNTDHYIYERLEQYSSNSGTAIGMNSEEAIIHGILESIERTSLSEFLTKTFLLNQEKQLRVVDTRTLPAGVQDVCSRIEKESGQKVFIFEMPNKFGIPAFCSWLEQDEYVIGMAGYGCSLSTEHAVLRSLYELAQYFLLGNHIFGIDWLKRVDESTLAQLKRLPLHQDCARLDLGSKRKVLGCTTVAFDELPAPLFSKNPKEYLAQLTDIIYAHGEVPFACPINTVGSEIKIIHSFVTGEDRFFNVRNGKSAFPVSLARHREATA